MENGHQNEATTNRNNNNNNGKKSKQRRFVSRPLQRNQACSTCRSRKVRCDAHKPACGACRRSAAAHGEDPNLVVCQYDQEHHPQEEDIFLTNSQIKYPSPKVVALEHKIAEIERLISQFDISLSSQQTPCPITPELVEPSISTGPSYFPSCELLLNRTKSLVRSSFQSMRFVKASEIIWSNWPSCLPPRRIISHLVKLYFSSSSGAGQRMFLEPARLLANLHLPPNHPDFPFVGLLHAIMAITYRQSVSGDPDQFALNLLRVCNIKRYWPMESSVHHYHGDRAKLLIEKALYDASHLFQLTQALNIYAYYAYETVQLVPAWVCSGLATRFSTPIGLNHLEKSIEQLEGSRPRPKSLLPEPATAMEKYARAVTFWLAFQMDRFLSVSAGRPHSISEADITSLLPTKPGTSQSTIGPVDVLSNPLSLSHPHFFSNHPYDVEEFQLELKATVLLGRVSDWLIRAPDPVGFNLRKYWQMPEGPIPDLRFQSDFIQLDQHINAFQMSLTPIFQQTIFEGEGRKVSHSKVMTILILNLSIILLHECFITKDQYDWSFQRCLQATSKIKSVGDLLFGAGYDPKLLHPFTNYCWAVAIRMMMRQLVQNEINLIELATASTTSTKALSTRWIHESFPSVQQPEAPENVKNEEWARLMRTEEAQVNQIMLEIESLLRFNTHSDLGNPEFDLHSDNPDHLSFQLPHRTQQPTQITPQCNGDQAFGGTHQNGQNHSFSNGIDSIHDGNQRLNLVDSQRYAHSSQISNYLDSDRTISNTHARDLNESHSYLDDHQLSTGILLQQLDGQSSHQNPSGQNPSFTHHAKLSFDRDHYGDRIKGLNQIYFDQMIKLFHIRFQAFRLPKSLSRIVFS